jgi:uncharacterized membrane protein
MKPNWLSILTLMAVLGSGLIAGVFFAFSSFVMQSLSKLPASQSIAAMNAVSVVILNSLFMLVFIGTMLLCVVLGAVWFFQRDQPGSSLLLIGSLLYLIGNILVTGMFNLPLNDSLAVITPENATPEAWRQYLEPWMFWNHVRTITALLASLAFIVRLLQD